MFQLVSAAASLPAASTTQPRRPLGQRADAQRHGSMPAALDRVTSGNNAPDTSAFQSAL